jgi:hypothetical protein
MISAACKIKSENIIAASKIIISQNDNSLFLGSDILF